MAFEWIWWASGAILFIILFLRVIQDYEEGLILTFGKYTSTRKAGLTLIIPMIQRLIKTDIRQRTIDLEPQSVMTKDQVNLKIDGVLFYRVTSARFAVLNVTDVRRQLEAKATSELKEIIGNKSMSEALAQRDEIANTLNTNLNKSIKEIERPWGVHLNSVQINNIELPDELVRAMAKQAEAEREKIARLTKAEGEAEAAKKFSEAAQLYQKNPAALKLRELQTYQEIGSEKNTLMLVIPEGVANFFSKK